MERKQREKVENLIDVRICIFMNKPTFVWKIGKFSYERERFFKNFPQTLINFQKFPRAAARALG